MRSRANEKEEAQIELFRIELIRIIRSNHELLRLADAIDWENFEACFEGMWADNNGRPAIDTRLMVSMHYLKYTFDLSDEDVVEAWLQRTDQHRCKLDGSFHGCSVVKHSSAHSRAA